MFFENNKEEITIDGIPFTLTPAAKQEHYVCKGYLVDIQLMLSDDMIEMNLSFENYTSWKKELIAALKKWDKHYKLHNSKKG